MCRTFRLFENVLCEVFIATASTVSYCVSVMTPVVYVKHFKKCCPPEISPNFQSAAKYQTFPSYLYWIITRKVSFQNVMWCLQSKLLAEILVGRSFATPRINVGIVRVSDLGICWNFTTYARQLDSCDHLAGSRGTLLWLNTQRPLKNLWQLQTWFRLNS